MELKLEDISGQATAIVFRNDTNGYTVVKLSQPDGGEITVIGVMPAVHPGEQLSLKGVWANHPVYGPQFKAEQFEYLTPTTDSEIYSFLASGAIKGLGPATVKLIVKKHGTQSLKIIEEQPELLAEIKGISPEKAINIGEAFRQQNAFRRLADFFSKNKLDMRHSMRVYNTYGVNSIDVISNNPYIMLNEQFGMDFRDCDSFAGRLGFELESLERIQAGVIYVLRHNCNNGHVFAPRRKLVPAVYNLVQVQHDIIEDAIESLLDSGDLVSEKIGGEDAVYLRSMHEAESAAAELLAQMSVRESRSSYDSDKIWGELSMPIDPADKQREAVQMAAGKSVFILTGGPGTGKTTTVKAILTLFDRMGLKTSLAAPTGRAAKRMSELCGREAQTIHRLLEANYDERAGVMVFKRNSDVQLAADAVILDETSMVDIELASALLSALKPRCRLILVGDADQLPSVGPGNVFRDIINSGIIPMVRLDQIFRQAAKSLIIRNAHMINQGGRIEKGQKSDDFFIISCRNSEAASNAIEQLCASRLPDNRGYLPEQIQVLTPTRINITGANELNRKLQNALNPPDVIKPEHQYGNVIFRVGDRVMQVRNNYELQWTRSDGEIGEGVFNGDVGYVIEINPKEMVVSVQYDDRIVWYSYDQLSELELAFAMTVHKAQGSEYRAVVLALADVPKSLLDRSVLYTAVTRARELLIIVGDADLVTQMIENDRPHKRYSALCERLINLSYSLSNNLPNAD